MSKLIQKHWCEDCGEGLPSDTNTSMHLPNCTETGEIETIAYFRKRRDKIVRIPDEWVGKTVHPQSIRKRESKEVRKVSRSVKRKYPGGKFVGGSRMTKDKAELEQQLEE